jgi:hypothetical protein
LKALVAREPLNPVLERAVRWLLLSRNRGVYWSSTKQTAIVLYGLLDFLRARDDAPERVEADVYVNGELAGSHAFTVEDWTNPDPVVISAPGRAGINQIRIARRGGGTLYWSAAAKYFYNGRALDASGTRKLALARRYHALTPVTEKGRIVYRETPFNGTAKVGDLLLVRLTAAGSSDWRYLVIEDPIPAGAEAIANAALYELERPQPWNASQREYRDDRVVVFQEAFEEGRYEFSYLLKVVSPGRFQAMPAQIWPMYVPDVNASTEAQTLIVPSEPARVTPSR